jgi:DNA-binding transcriptional MerR regulator
MTVIELQTSEDLFRGEEVFSTGEMAALLGVSSDEIDYWAQLKLLTPSIKRATGQGSRRLFNRNDLRQAFLVQKLRAAGWKPRQITKALAAVVAVLSHPASLHTPLLLHEGNALLIVCRDKGKALTLLDAANPGQYVMVIALETLEEETRQKLAQSK